MREITHDGQKILTKKIEIKIDIMFISTEEHFGKEFTFQYHYRGVGVTKIVKIS